jgi:hypothetical protein
MDKLKNIRKKLKEIFDSYLFELADTKTKIELYNKLKDYFNSIDLYDLNFTINYNESLNKFIIEGITFKDSIVLESLFKDVSKNIKESCNDEDFSSVMGSHFSRDY